MGNGILNTQHGDGNTKYISSTLYRDYTTDSAKSYKPRPAVAFLPASVQLQFTFCTKRGCLSMLSIPGSSLQV